MWRQVAIYGLVLATGATALQWLDYQWFARAHAQAVIIGLVALGCLGLGVWAGVRLTSPAPAPGPEGNRAALAQLGISARELDVLREMAAGRSNKEIAQRLHVSPNTVKTHVGRLLEKLGARRRTEAIARARDLGLMGDSAQIIPSGD